MAPEKKLDTSKVLAAFITPDHDDDNRTLHAGMPAASRDKPTKANWPCACGPTCARCRHQQQASAKAQLTCFGAEPVSDTMYRWECAIRSSVVPGHVGAGALGQLLVLVRGLFHWATTVIIVGAMLLVTLVAPASYGDRRATPR